MPDEHALLIKAKELQGLAVANNLDQNGMICRKLTELVIDVRSRSLPADSFQATPTQIDELIAVGNFEGAVFASLRGVAGYMLSRGMAGDSFATILIGGEGSEYSGVGSDEVRALAAAFATGCLERYGNELN